MSLIEVVRFMDLLEWFSMNLRDVHPVKTVCVCPWKQLQESVCHAVCVDTCSDAQMWPDSQSAGVSVELDFTLSFCLLGIFPFFPRAVKEAVVFHTVISFPLKMSCYPNSTIGFNATDFWSHSCYSLSLRGVFCVFFFSWHGDANMQSSRSTISDKIWRFCYQVSIPASPI